MKNINILFVFILVAFLINTGCQNNDAVDGVINREGFTFNVAFDNIGTRALSTEEGDFDGNFNEKKINKLDLFFYDGTILKWHVQSTNLTYDANSQKVTIPVTAEKRALFVNNTSRLYDIYVVANNSADLTGIAEDADNLVALKNLVATSPSFSSLGGATAQPDLLMDGKVSEIVNLNNPELGTINLKRAASKIRIKLMAVNVPGFTLIGLPQARLVHFSDKTALMDGGVQPTISDWKNTSTRNITTTVPIGLGGGSTTAAPFYAYENDWSSIASRESYIELYVPLREDATANERTYKYRVPLTPRNLTGENSQYMNKLQRNILYDIGVIVKILGSLDEPPVEVTGSYLIKDWSTQEILVNIKGSHYLVVSEYNVIMPNITSYNLTFNSSIPNVVLVPNSLKATYTYVSDVTGEPTTVNVTGNQIPSITVQPNVASGNITIQSAIPVNFIPKDIEFQVTNGPLTEKVIIRQLPATYFVTEKGNRSILRNQLDPSHNNPYMYSITTLAPGGSIIWGFPPLDTNGNTINSAEVANIVSPKFMMASQLGATTTMNYSSGVTNCRNYWEETTKNGVTVRYDDWRLPTEAEIKYIDDLQHNSNNPQGVVMRGNYYWDAYSGNNAYKMKAPITSSGFPSDAHVRCIRDIKN